jgi:glycerol uptake facilitator-like aquaporin
MQGQLNLRACVAELVGTFLFFAIGFTAVQATGALQAPVLLVVPFAFGFGLLAAIAAFGHISGGHFNPAVTVAMVLDGRTTVIDAVGYIVAQILVILTSSRKAPVFAGIIIPLTLVAIHFAAVPFSGASVNPARSIGPALLGGDLGSLWIYLVGPIVGAVIGWAAWVLVSRDEPTA